MHIYGQNANFEGEILMIGPIQLHRPIFHCWFPPLLSQVGALLLPNCPASCLLCLSWNRIFGSVFTSVPTEPKLLSKQNKIEIMSTAVKKKKYPSSPASLLVGLQKYGLEWGQGQRTKWTLQCKYCYLPYITSLWHCDISMKWWSLQHAYYIILASLWLSMPINRSTYISLHNIKVICICDFLLLRWVGCFGFCLLLDN